MSVMAVVVAGGRRGAGVDVLTPVGGVPMVASAARCLLDSGLVDHVLVLDADGGGDEGSRRDALAHACSGMPVTVRDATCCALFGTGTHAGQRAGATVGDGQVTMSQSVVLLHDAARPLAPPALAAAVVDAVRSGHAVAVPVLPLADTVKQVDAAGVVLSTPDRARLRVVQTPLAIRGALLDPGSAVNPLTVALRHAEAGGSVHTVPGHPAAFAVHSAWDLELAELLAGAVRP